MSDTKHDVAVEFTAKDSTSSVIGRINKSAGVLGKTVDNITRKVAGFSALGGLATVFGFGASVHSANKYLSTIEMLSTITGETANKTAGMVHAMEQSGVAGEETKAIMISMARKQAEIVGGSKDLAKMAKKYGVELTKGPDKALVSMAKSVKEGKIGTGEVVKLLEESGSKAMDLLRKGPVEVQRLLSEGAKKNSHINKTSIAQYKQMTIQMTRVKQSWTRITTAVMIKLAPSLTKLMAYVERNIDSWTEGAGQFGDLLVNHIGTALVTARVFGKVMMANYAIMKLTGEGLVGNAGKLLKMSRASSASRGSSVVADVASSVLGRGKGKGAGALISGRKGVAAKKAAAAAAGGRTKKIGIVFGKIFKFTTKIGGVFSRVVASVGPLIKVASILMRLTAVGVVIAAVVVGIKQIMNNVDGIRDRLGSLLGKVWEDIKNIGESVGNLFGPGSFLREFFSYVGKGFVSRLEKLLWAFQKVTHALAVASVMLSERVGPAKAEFILKKRAIDKNVEQASKTRGIMNTLLEHQGKVTLSQIDMLGQMKKSWMASTSHLKDFDQSKEWKDLVKTRGLGKFAALPVTPKERQKTNFDFRGSRFDIQQNFAEGFDPDRIAVAFSNDLSSLGERRLQSGLAPAFSAR